MGITKQELYDDNTNLLATLFKVLGHPARITFMVMPKERGSAAVGELKREMNLSQSTVSEHLIELKRIPLIKGTQIGTSVRYEIHEMMWTAVRDVLISFSDEF